MATALIQPRGTVSGNQPRVERWDEAASQVFLAGTPLQLVAGVLQAWDGTTITNGIAGISLEFGASLATAGVPLGTVLAPTLAPFGGGGIKFGSVPNQPNAANLSRPYFNDGKTGVVLAIPDTLFYGQVGPSQATLLADIGAEFGLTKDATDNHWYVDRTKNTTATAVVQVVGLDPWDKPPNGVGGRGVLFVFLASAGEIEEA